MCCWCADGLQEVTELYRSVGSGQGIEIALVCRLGDLSTVMQVGNTATEGTPLALPAGIILSRSIGLEVLRVVHGEFSAQDSCEFVIELDGIFPHSMLDPNPFGAVFEITDHLAFEVTANFAPKKTH